ncbi:MAG: methyltransferase domain-containing protein [Nitrospiraceae bacterium]|nr:MAG: methyltransferase domain-containing protein [Nitrospiraceae bacterium]
MMNILKVRQLPSEWIKANLGCHQAIVPGWINVDKYPYEGVDTVMDLEDRWGWEDNSLHYIRAFDIVEHLKDPIHTMNEAWRVLKHGGIFEVWVPSTDGRGAFQDPTHVSYWNQNSFFYYSKKHYGRSYPDKIFCDFDIRSLDTDKNLAGNVWTWALCRAIKDATQIPAISDAWFKALSSMDAKARIMPGFEGTSIGTTKIE